MFCRCIIQVLPEVRQMWASTGNASIQVKLKKTIYRIPGLGSEDILIYLIFFEVFKCKLNNFLIIPKTFLSSNQ